MIDIEEIKQRSFIKLLNRYPDLKRIYELEPYSKEYIKEHEYELRQDIARIAKKWLGASYSVNGKIPYKQCDCHTILMLVYAEARIIKFINLNDYNPDFSFHSYKETYLEGVQKYGKQVIIKKVGDIILYRYARLVDHAAIVIDENGTMLDTCITRGVTLQEYNQPINKQREVAV